jgi:hypothetical protein
LGNLLVTDVALCTPAAINNLTTAQ